MRPVLRLVLLLVPLVATACDMQVAPDLRGLECITPGITEVRSSTCDSLARAAKSLAAVQGSTPSAP
jgi:hypothetical protein